MKRWVPLSLWAVCVGTIGLFCSLWHFRGPLGTSANYFGLAPIVIGSALCVFGLSGLVRARTTVGAFHEPTRLVTGGIYRLTRNPVYLGMTLMLTGSCILLGASCMLAPVAVFLFVVDRWIVRPEERRLVGKFGSEYERYRSRVPRWI